MAAGVYNFKVEQGVSYSFKITYKDKNVNPIPLDDYTPYGSIKLKMSDTGSVAQFGFEKLAGIGELQVKLAHNAFSNVQIKANSFNDYVQGVYDIYLVKSDESQEHIRLLNGVIDISPQVTKYV